MSDKKQQGISMRSLMGQVVAIIVAITTIYANIERVYEMGQSATDRLFRESVTVTPNPTSLPSSAFILTLPPSLSNPTATLEPDGEVDPVPEDYADYIYRIEISGCNNPPASRVQTGFKLEGEPGIFTALHGVNGCADVTAVSESGTEYFVQLEKINIAKDTAYLFSDRLDSLDGIPIGTVPDHSCAGMGGTDVKVLGYPAPYHSVDPKDGTVQCKRTLNSKIPGGAENEQNAIREIFRARHSPSLETPILDVDMLVRPGHSGAPVLKKEDGTFIGMIIGGIEDKTWAIIDPHVGLNPQRTFGSELVSLANLEIPSQLMSVVGSRDAPATATASATPTVPGIPTPVPTATISPTPEPFIAISDQKWSGFEIAIDGFYAPANGWIVIYRSPFDDIGDSYLAKQKIAAGSGNALTVVLVGAEDGQQERKQEVEATLATGASVELIAVLYEDTDKNTGDEFDPTAGFNRPVSSNGRVTERFFVIP